MGKSIDRTGMRYGYLTVLNKEGHIGEKVTWKCRCDCGNIVVKKTDALKNNSMCDECYGKYRRGEILNPLNQLHPQIKNEIGNRYGKLLVLDIDKDKSKLHKGVVWKCQCDCGNITSVHGASLRRGGTTSCGCNHRVDEMPGTKYGLLTIIKRVENSKAGRIRYLCQCECGNQCVVAGSDLRFGNQISCGCNKSKGELKIIQLLNQSNITYNKEAKFSSCKDKSSLPFDFQIILPNGEFYLIEYDGRQHTDVSQAWNEYSYEYTAKHDQIKNQWCKDNNIQLIRIPHWHLKDLCIEDLLLETTTFLINS